MIARSGGRLAHLGGLYGDLLSLSVDAGAFRPVAELGRGEVTPQRRLSFEGDTLLVLEPVEGPLLRPPLRVRRFPPGGSEGARSESGRESGEGRWLSVLFERSLPGPLHITLCGTLAGHPVHRRMEIDVDVARKPRAGSGTPLEHDGTLWIPVREEGLARVGGAGAALMRGPVSACVELVDGRVVCAGRRGAFLDGAWVRTGPGPDWPPYRAPLSGLAAPGILLLCPGGGVLPRLAGEGPPGWLPPGRYSSLAKVGDSLFAVREGATPELVPVRFDSPA